MKNLFIVTVALLLTQLASASAVTAKGGSDVGSGQAPTVMSCMIGVFTAQDMANPNPDPAKLYQTVSIPLTGEQPSAEAKINGEKLTQQILISK